MTKSLFFLCLPLFLAACSANGEQYYQTNPPALQEAIKNCPAKSPNNISCTELVEIAREVNSLAYQLQSNPQEFGKKILDLQETLAKQKADLENSPEKNTLTREIEKNNQQLAQYLAIVRWLESPES